jgi:hypothetical protein
MEDIPDLFAGYVEERARSSFLRVNVATRASARLRNVKAAQDSMDVVVNSFRTSNFSFVRSRKLSAFTDCSRSSSLVTTRRQHVLAESLVARCS